MRVIVVLSAVTLISFEFINYYCVQQGLAVMLSRKSERLLNEIYYNVKHPAGFSNASRLYHAVKGKGITFQDVREFLSRQRAHQLTRPNRYKYARRRTVSMGLDHFWQADLVEVAHDAYSRRINQGGVNYLLTVIDVLSRHAWVVPLKTKSAESASRALELNHLCHVTTLAKLSHNR